MRTPMPMTTPAKRTGREKVRADRARLRAQGVRPIQIWVPDVTSPAFKAEAHRQSRLIAASWPNGPAASGLMRLGGRRCA